MKKILNKIEYFFRCLKVCKEKSPNELRKYMNIQFRNSLKSYYKHKNKVNLDDFTQVYVRKFESYFKETLSPTNYLIQQTVINSGKQLSLIKNINHKLIVKHLPRPFNDVNQSQPTQELNFSDFEQFKNSENDRLSHYKSSQQVESIAEESGKTIESIKYKEEVIEDKKAVFKHK